MKLEEFLNKQYDISTVAGMNQRYHQHQAHRSGNLDAIAKVVTAVFAFLGFATALAAWLYRATPESGHFLDETIDVVGVFIAFAAAIIALILNVLPFASQEKEHSDLFRQYSDLRESVEWLKHGVGDDDPTKRMVEELAEMDSRLHRLCGSERLADPVVWRKCENDERRSRGLELLREAVS